MVQIGGVFVLGYYLKGTDIMYRVASCLTYNKYDN